MPSVILFVLDSMSNSNWQRNLQKTLKVLKSEYNSYIFKGLTKVGDNSFPNAMAFLTGKLLMAHRKTSKSFRQLKLSKKF